MLRYIQLLFIGLAVVFLVGCFPTATEPAEAKHIVCDNSKVSVISCLGANGYPDTLDEIFVPTGNEGAFETEGVDYTIGAFCSLTGAATYLLIAFEETSTVGFLRDAILIMEMSEVSALNAENAQIARSYTTSGMVAKVGDPVTSSVSEYTVLNYGFLTVDMTYACAAIDVS